MLVARGGDGREAEAAREGVGLLGDVAREARNTSVASNKETSEMTPVERFGVYQH